MKFFWQGLREAWHLIVSGDPYLTNLLEITLKVLAVSTVGALVIGLPIGVTLGLGRFRGRNALVVLANAGLAIPPIVVGLILFLVLLPPAPLSRFHLLYTLHGVYLAQICLGFPIVAALTVSALRDIAPGLVDQARALGAGRWQVALLAVREARIGIMAATIAAAGSALSEVGAVVLVGGNVLGVDQTLASAALTNADAGHYADGMAIGILLLGLIVVVSGLLTWLQYGRGTLLRLRELR